MERHEILDIMGSLKLAGMRTAFAGESSGSASQ
jgi:UDP-3-O-acyl-N-acetylglucosamine deacetylase